MDLVGPEEKLFVDYTAYGKPCCIKFKTDRLPKWIDIVKFKYKSKEEKKPNDTVELRHSNVVITCYSSGVVCVQGAGFMKWAVHDFPDLQSSLNDSTFKSSDLTSLSDLLRENQWYIKKQRADGHCLIYAIAETSSLEEDFIIEQIKNEATTN